MEDKNIEDRLRALEEKLNPSPDKMSTMKATNRLKQMLDEMKEDKESQEDVVWRLKEQAEKVPALENENEELRAKAWEEHLDYERLKDEYQKLKLRMCTVELEKKEE